MSGEAKPDEGATSVPVCPEIRHQVPCPGCGRMASAKDWHLPGLWLMGEYCCDNCGRHFLQDLPYSLGVVIPSVLDLKSGQARPVFGGQWHADNLQREFGKRVNEPAKLQLLRNPPPGPALLVSCLYPWWGDAVSLLLRINALLQPGRLPVVVLINRGLLWLVPDEVAGVWVVGEPVSRNGVWNDGLTAAVKEAAAKQQLQLAIPQTFQHAYLQPSEMERFYGIAPFPREEWSKRLEEGPVVTFVWRADRVWSHHEHQRSRPESTTRRRLRRLWRKLTGEDWFEARGLADQVRRVTRLAEDLRRSFPQIEFCVCGLGRQGKLPDWIKDLRVDHIGEETNQEWCRQAARSHIVVGVLGSHLTMPGSLSGAYVELVPESLITNIMTCAPVTQREPREALFGHRLLPVEVSAGYLGRLLTSLLLNYPYVALSHSDGLYGSLNERQLEMIRTAFQTREAALARVPQEIRQSLGN